MIVRIVKMTFQADKISNFIHLFKQSKSKIKQYSGCLYLELLMDIKEKNIYYTYSHWADEQALEKYRKSEFFRNTWAQTKVLFAAKPEAVSLISLTKVG